MATTRDTILRSAQTLLARSGLAGASLNPLIALSGAPRGSLYHYFPAGKEQWVREALSAYSEYFTRATEAVLAAAPTPGAGVEAALQLLAAQLEKTGYTGGCPVGAVILDLDADTATLRGHCQQIMAGWQTALAKHLGELPPERRDELAQFVVITLEGALMLARLQQSSQPILSAARLLRQCIDHAPR